MSEVNYRKLPYYRTTVQIYKSQNEIRSVLQKFGLQGIRFTDYKETGTIEFILLKDEKELSFRFTFNYPEREDFQRQVYRGLFHYIKNRFFAVEFGINTIEKEFLQEMILKLPDGSTPTIKDLVSKQLSGLAYTSELQLPFKEKDK